MKRLFIVAAIVALVLVPGTASAQERPGGCRELGEAVAGFADLFHPFGEVISGLAPVSEEVHADMARICP